MNEHHQPFEEIKLINANGSKNNGQQDNLGNYWVIQSIVTLYLY
ncbi:DNA-damage-inducible protein D [Escherichia coli]|uniref:DNA-damage-inducible protein D n=1 Tax=Escherichia coli TaxID=562 RepID=A0A2X1PIP0_ECOLX|nr:DNA-damage-inducible protein D [Escherichia coli]